MSEEDKKVETPKAVKRPVRPDPNEPPKKNRARGRDRVLAGQGKTPVFKKTY